MPLQHLIDTFNDRFIHENRLDRPPLRFNGEQVHGHFGHLTFTSQFKTVRLHARPRIVIGHDTAPLVFTPANAHDTARLLYADTVPNIVSLDRLSRTVHMLNYLILDQAEGSLFLHVHPHHVLTIKKDHGAYFEDIIRRCGLPLRRIVIGLTLNAVYESQFLLLLERLRNYRDRGYSTAVKFDEKVGIDLVERFRIQFLHRFTPDYVRFNTGFFHKDPQDKPGQRRRRALLSALRQIDTQLLIGAVKSTQDAHLTRQLNPDYVEGSWYDQSAAYDESLPIAV